MSNIGATFNALVELPDLEDEYFRKNLTAMLRTASSFLANLKHRPNSDTFYQWELVLDARENFVTKYLSEYGTYLQNRYADKSEVSADFFLGARLKSITTIMFIFDQALDLSIQLKSNMSMAQ